MAEAKANMDECINCNKKAILIAVTIVVLAVIFMFFRDRQQKRETQLEGLETQTGVWEEWGPPQQSQQQQYRQNRQPNNTRGQGGRKIL